MTDRTKYCNDYGDAPGCLGTPDERYTMRFDDIGEPPILWCSHCGPRNRALGNALSEALKIRGPEFQAEVEKLIDEASAQKVRQ